MKRRQYLGALSIPALLALTGGAGAQTLPEPQGFEPADTWVGDSSDRPAPDWVGFDNATGTVAYLATDSGALATLEVETDGGWRETPTHLVEYNQANLPTGIPSGTVFFDKDRGLPAWWDRDHYEWPNFVDDVLTASVTNSNFSTKTEYWSFDINAGSLIKGRTYELDMTGAFGTANTSDRFTVIVDLGGNEIATLQNAAANVADVPWHMETKFTVREHGATGKVKADSRGLFNSEPNDDDHPETTLDTSVAHTLKISVSWDAADVANTVTLSQAHLKQMA